MKPRTSTELRDLYLRFFESKDHAVIPSAPLVPENDPSVLFTTAGMHPLVPYLKGQAHPAGSRLANAQICLRTTDIDEVGDSTHATVFEMLGNWSLGDYFKEDAIALSWEFLTSEKWLGLDPQRLAVSVFAGDDDAARDTVAAGMWERVGIPTARIAYLDKKENWWPAGGGAPGPQGPDTEIFYWTGTEEAPIHFDHEDDRWVEIWNNVFMQYNLTDAGTYEALPQQNVDTGMGLERVVMVLNGHKSIYEIDTYRELLQLIATYRQQDDLLNTRILADHMKAATFVLADAVPVTPGNTEQGYVLRRIIRRAVLAMRRLGFTVDASEFATKAVRLVVATYGQHYTWLASHEELAIKAMQEEIRKFDAAIDKGLAATDKFINELHTSSGNDQKMITGKDAFFFYETHGLPLEVFEEMLDKANLKLVQREEFFDALKTHQDKSRTAAAGKFKGGLADHSEMSIKYHTATHLLHQALRTVLGDHVLQRGSNITPDRLRFDFSHPDKMTDEQRAEVESLVNDQIKANVVVTRDEMSVDEAKQAGALGVFDAKYGDKVSVYSIGNFSKEICGGPHVERTGSMGVFRIKKEESASAGVRRIKAVLE